jgi:hypothetical protein
MRPEGIYGAWLRTLPVAVEIDNTLFIHAGVSPAMEGMDVATINRRAAEEIERFDRHRATMVGADLCLPTASARDMVQVISEEAAFLNGLAASQRTTANPRVATLLEIRELGQWGSWSLIAENGPLWFPGASRWPDELTSNMTAILDGLGVERMVTGQSDGKERLVRTRFENRVLLTSVGPSDDPYARGGNPAALEIVNKDYFVVTLGGRELLIDGP